MLTLLCLSSALAEPATFTTDGEVRLIGAAPPNPVVDATGTVPGQGPVLDSRLRASGGMTAGTVTLATEWDLLTGQLVGDTWELGATGDERRRGELDAVSLAGITPRRASVAWRTRWFEAEGGLVTSQWGLGVVANNGAADPLFGRTDFGDRVLRARFTSKPGQAPIYLSLAGDLVVEDEIARLSQGEQAWQGITSALYADPKGRKLGAYLVYRTQREQDPTRHTRAGVVDLYGDLPVPVGDWTLRLATEGAVIGGFTDEVLTYTSREGLSLGSAGVAVRTSLSMPDDLVTAHLRGGWASGDGKPDDGGYHAFAFDRDYDAGMVLFDEVMAAIEAGTQAQLLDPRYSAVPPDGVDGLTHEGALVGASYVQPAVQARPLDWLDLRLGLVLGWSTAPISQPFASYRNGGVAAGPGGAASGGYALGTEVDWALGFGRAVGEDGRPQPQALLQGGHAFLSDDLGGGRMDLLLATARLRW